MSLTGAGAPPGVGWGSPFSHPGGVGRQERCLDGAPDSGWILGWEEERRWEAWKGNAGFWGLSSGSVSCTCANWGSGGGSPKRHLWGEARGSKRAAILRNLGGNCLVHPWRPAAFQIKLGV
jgi:hypothetical protein